MKQHPFKIASLGIQHVLVMYGRCRDRSTYRWRCFKSYR